MGRSASSSIVVKPKLQKINFLLSEEKSDTDGHFERKGFDAHLMRKIRF